MTAPLGARLRRHREEQAIDLTTIAAQTKIKLSLLEGLERDDLTHWPPGIFRRAYIRAYAHAIGLNPDTVVRDFLEVHPDPPEMIDPAASPQGTSGQANGSGPPTRLRNLVGSAVGSLSRLRRGGMVEPRVTQHSAPAIVRETFEPDLAPVPSPPEPPAPEPLAVKETIEAPTETRPPVDLVATARLCTELGRVEHASQMPPLLQEAARILDARGLIVWVWDGIAAELLPALVHGYSDKVVAQLPSLKEGADNLTAAAFRSTQTLAMHGTPDTSGALAVPLLTPGACAGVLAIELTSGAEESEAIRAAATILAAMLAQLVGGGPAASTAATDDEEHAPLARGGSTAL